MNAAIHFTRIGKGEALYVEELLRDDGVRLDTRSVLPPEAVHVWSKSIWQKQGIMANGERVVEVRKHHFYHQWFDVIELLDEQGSLLGYYCDVITPLVKVDGEYYLRDLLLDDGLRDQINKELMGEETERLAQVHEVTREELDEVAILSQQRAAAATAKGKFDAEITPVIVDQRGKSVVINHDEGIRAETTSETLGKLRPAFGSDGVLTAGNSSQLSDGAAMLVLASGRAVEQHNLKPIARILGSSWHAVTPWRFVEGPIPAVQKLAKKLGMEVGDFDLFENNEAFALNNVLFQQSLGLSAERVNVYGGGIALGHPFGASGARVIVTLLLALRQEGGSRGMASLCHGLGGGTALAVELV